MNQQDAQRWADEVARIERDMVAGYCRSGEWDEFCLRHGNKVDTRILMEATCAWIVMRDAGIEKYESAT